MTVTADVDQVDDLPRWRRRRRSAALLVDQAGRQMRAALTDIAAARTELDVAVVELHQVLDDQEAGPT